MLPCGDLAVLNAIAMREILLILGGSLDNSLCKSEMALIWTEISKIQ